MRPGFLQDPPRLGNTFEGDAALRETLAALLPAGVMAELAPGLRRLGERAAGEMMELASAAEAAPPRHVPYGPWGERVDHIEVSPAWRRLHEIAAEEGLVATAYERRHGAASRLEQFAKIYLFHPSSAFVSCPLAMTDGAARVLELAGSTEQRSRVLPHLLTRESRQFWTSGQWMTEKSGGSDVSGTETVARREGGGFRLYGAKWFTSATTAEVALTLARIEGAPPGNRGLSLFLVELRDETGRLAGVRIERLKDKLGTRALPTAELELCGTSATLVGDDGRGVATVATMLNITRLWNAGCATSTIARGLALARDYAHRRFTFGRPLAGQPLHLSTLARIAAEHRAALALTFRAAELLGRAEVGTATPEEELLLRILTPLTKLATGKQAPAAASELLEAFGGAGYIEDTGLPRLLRDAQVFPIWEGTTNVLALDALRTITREGAHRVLLADAERMLAEVESPELAGSRERWRARIREVARFVSTSPPQTLEGHARALAVELARVYTGALLTRQAAHGGEAARTAAEIFGDTAFPPLSLGSDALAALALG